MVFSSKVAMNASYPSLVRRFFGFPSWWITAATGPLLVACLALTFYLAGDGERQYDQAGLAPIVKLARRKDHWELAAALTPALAVTPGAIVDVMDRHRQPHHPHDRHPYRKGNGLWAGGCNRKKSRRTDMCGFSSKAEGAGWF